MAGADRRPDRKRRAFWLKHLYRWHWISSALCLVGMFLFAATGITLNHAAEIGTTPRVTTRQAQVPGALLAVLRAGPGAGKAPVPAPLADWLAAALSVTVGDREAEWSTEEVYLSLPRCCATARPPATSRSRSCPAAGSATATA